LIRCGSDPNSDGSSFALTNTTVSIATPGASGTSTITIMLSGGFSSKLALSCTVNGPAAAVDRPTCSLAAPPAITGIRRVSATLTVNTTAASSSSNATGHAAMAFRNQHNRMLALDGGGALVAFLFFGLPLRRPRTKFLPSLLLLGAFAAIVMGCGGAQKAANPVTTPANPRPDCWELHGHGDWFQRHPDRVYDRCYQGELSGRRTSKSETPATSPSMILVSVL
jgi:hypothetical protein